MKRWGLILMVFGGCCNKPEPCVEVKGIQVDPLMLDAMKFCQSQGQSLLRFEHYDWTKIGENNKYEIDCSERKNP